MFALLIPFKFFQEREEHATQPWEELKFWRWRKRRKRRKRRRESIRGGGMNEFRKTAILEETSCGFSRFSQNVNFRL